MKEIEVIEIEWIGPFTTEQVMSNAYEGKKFEHEYGLYQICGTHNVFGHSSLLYIGQAYERPFSTRLKEHDWINYESNQIQIFLGKLGGVNQPEKAGDDYPVWKQQVDWAERLLVNFCSPPYNSSFIIKHGIDEKEKVLLLNFGRKNVLPYCLTNLIDTSKYWEKESGQWNYYEENKILDPKLTKSESFS